MDYETASECDEVERAEIEAELMRHDCEAWSVDSAGRFIDDSDGSVIAAPDASGFYFGGDVLAWLGY